MGRITHRCINCNASSWHNRRIYLRRKINDKPQFIKFGWFCDECGNIEISEICLKELKG